jgi:hypothetical protein
MEDTNNITLEENPTPAQVKLTDIAITDEIMALNVIISFLGVAQQRGTFSIAESAKIYECIQQFINKNKNDTNESA